MTQTLRDKELQDHYDQVFAMHGTRGWARLQVDVEAAITSHNSLAGIETAEQLWFRKGQLDQMFWLQNHQAAHETTYSALLVEQEGGEEQPSTGGVGKVIR